MIELRTVFDTEKEKEDYVKLCEKEYTDRVIAVAHGIAADRPRFLMISGPTCSGKTTTSHILSRELKKHGLNAKIISIDDFFYGKEYVAEHNVDIESIDAVDMEYFSECVNKISKSEKAMLPHFNFVKGRRTSFSPYKPKRDDLIIFEGIQALYPEILAVIPKEMRKTLYLGFFDDVNAGLYTFTAKEIRFYRRLVRDTQFRGSNVTTIIHQWENLTTSEDEHIIPNAKNTDYKIDTFLKYELLVMKKYLLEYLHYETEIDISLYGQIKMKCSYLPDIPSEYVPKRSMLREFIGT